MIRLMLAMSLVFVLGVTIFACVAREDSEPAPRIEESTPPVTPEQPTPTPVPERDPSPTPVPTHTPTPEPTPTETLAPIPSPTPEPERIVRSVTETPCCGLFAWLSDAELLVFDGVNTGQEGSWRVDVERGERTFLSHGFGLPSRSGTIAFPRARDERVEVRDFEGAQVGSVPNAGEVAWPSPDGTRIAWLEHLPVRTPSSSVNRAVRLHVGDVQAGTSREVLDLQAAEVHWLPDNRQLIVPARDLEFGQAGIWQIDIETGEYEIVFQERFIQSVRTSPNGALMAMLRTFNDDPHQSGIWVLDLQSGEMTSLGTHGPYRWDAGSDTIWLLEMTETGTAEDRLVLIDVETGERLDSITLEGQVLNDAWEISPDGTYVAFWRHDDGQVIVQLLH